MVVEQTYVGVAAREDRVTPLTSEIGVYAVLGFVAGPSVGALFAPLNLDYGRWRVDEFTAPGYFVGLLCVAMMVACYLTFNPSDAVWKSKTSSRRRVDGLEDDAMIQHERAVKF